MRIGASFARLAAGLMSRPDLVLREQAAFWQRYAELCRLTAERLLFNTSAAPVIEPDPGDRRFADARWTQNAGFDFIKQSYLLAAQSVTALAAQAAESTADPHERRKAAFYLRLALDALAPANYLGTNPQALQATLDSGGENLRRGLAQLLDDLQRGQGHARPKTADLSAFRVGENLATTPGKVVFQNELMQLIQYAPSTPTVHRRPLLIVPPWINKYYILDLRPENSVIRWAVGEGHTVFVISWVNPGSALAHKSFDDYLREGPLAALDAVAAATGVADANAIGYCIGGTLLACTLAVLAARNEARVRSATFLTTLLDFADPGEIAVFIDEQQIGAMESEMQRYGYFDGRSMATAFNLLRDNELIWHYGINNYLLGREPPAFDLLYWGMDSTHMPAAMHEFYLRNMYQHNRLREPGALRLAGVPVDLGRIKTPAYFLATSEDHIAPWRSAYAGAHLLSGPVRFVLTGSGHNAGVINLPDARRTYGYWNGERLAPSADDWLAQAQHHDGSWWSDWSRWLRAFAGKAVAARQPDSTRAIEDAPGSYVKVRCD